MDDLDDLDDIGEVPPEEEYPTTPFPCGAVVQGERLGHCPGCYGNYGGCCRTFYGIRAWDKHHVVNRSANTRRCRSDAELIELGMVRDGPVGSWRFPSTPMDHPNAPEQT